MFTKWFKQGYKPHLQNQLKNKLSQYHILETTGKNIKK